MKKISILFLLCSCLFCACKKDKISLEGKTITMNIKDGYETLTYQVSFSSASDFTFTLKNEAGYYRQRYGMYSYDKNKLSLYSNGETYEIACETKTKKKSSLDGTKWMVTWNNAVAILELNSATYQYQGGGGYERGSYNYNGQILTFAEEDRYIDVSCGSLLYDMAKK